MPSFCRQCGHALDPDDKFCGDCGASTRPVEAAPSTTAEVIAEQPGPVVEDGSVEPGPVEPSAESLAVAGDDSRVGDVGFLTGFEGDTRFAVVTRAADTLSRSLGHPATFFAIYLIAVIPTYLLPYAGSNSMLNAVGSSIGTGALPAFWVHLTFLYVCAALAWIRGGLIGRSWLPILPVFAAIFDMTPGFNWIPLIPTGFHVATLIVGARDPLPGTDLSAQGRRSMLALIGLALMVLLAIYKWTAFYANMNSEFAELDQTVTSDMADAAVVEDHIPPPVMQSGMWEGRYFEGGEATNFLLHVAVDQDTGVMRGRIVETRGQAGEVGAQVEGFVNGETVHFEKRYDGESYSIAYDGTTDSDGERVLGGWKTDVARGDFELTLAQN